MSSYKVHRRRIVRREDSADAPVVSLLSCPSGISGSHGAISEESEVEARHQAWQEGYDAAMAEFLAAAEVGRAAALRRLTESLVASADLVAARRREVVSLGEVEVVELACGLAEAILGQELSATRPALAAATRALRLIPEGEDIVVRVNPDDALGVEDIQELVPDSAVKVVGDPSIELGGCLVVAGACQVDAQISSALGRARQVLDDLHLTGPSTAKGQQQCQ